MLQQISSSGEMELKDEIKIMKPMQTFCFCNIAAATAPVTFHVFHKSRSLKVNVTCISDYSDAEDATS